MLRRPYGLYPKYVTWIGVLVVTQLLLYGGVNLYFAWSTSERHLVALQHEKAQHAAMRIQQYFADIDRQMQWTRLLPDTPGADVPAVRRRELLRLLRQVPAVMEAAWIDGQTGQEQVRVSRLRLDQSGHGRDRTRETIWTSHVSAGVWYGPLTFHQNTEPRMTMARHHRDGIIEVEINLKFAWEVVAALHQERELVAYVVDGAGQLVAHPDLSLVLRGPGTPSMSRSEAAVLAASAPMTDPAWTVWVESPRAVVLRPVYDSLLRLGSATLLGLVLAVVTSAYLARTLVQPIRALQEGAKRVGAGDLGLRLHAASGDELGTLAEYFNQMAESLCRSYATLEERVSARTVALEHANEAKNLFLAAASHDLRQPVHALGLFAGQLRFADDVRVQRALIDNIEASVDAFQSLLASLLDLSQLDAGGVVVQPSRCALTPLLHRLVDGHVADAEGKGLRLRLYSRQDCWVDTDAILLGRVVDNLLGNAVRYTTVGGVLLTCRARGAEIELRVIDTGIGIHPADQDAVFREFVRGTQGPAAPPRGLGLGLAIVRRLVDVLGYRLSLRSRPGCGTTFSLWIPRLPAAKVPAVESSNQPLLQDHSTSLHGRSVLVVDDDSAVREGTRGLLDRWGMRVTVAAGVQEACAVCPPGSPGMPDVLICDLRLGLAHTEGLALAIEYRARGSVHVVVITGDIDPTTLQAVRRADMMILHKPLRPARLRALLESMLGGPTRPMPGSDHGDGGGGV